MNKNIEFNDVKTAYRKLKSYLYYDNFSLFDRQKLSEFETSEDFEDKLQELSKFLVAPDLNKEYFHDLLNQINYFIVPKKYDDKSYTNGNLITNQFTYDEYPLDKVNYFIGAPIEIHLISCLWVMKEGFVLDESYRQNNYAYSVILNKESNKVVGGLRLFKKYFTQYQIWRDKGIYASQNLIKDGNNALIISLDIKQYYYNIDIKKKCKQLLKELKEGLLKNDLSEDITLTKLLLTIHSKYQDKIKHLPNPHSIIPIGLLSSGVIANWYLKEFDNQIIEELSPVYYGRYVDDIQIVLANTADSIKKKNPENCTISILKKYFCDRNILRNINSNDNNIKPKFLK